MRYAHKIGQPAAGIRVGDELGGYERDAHGDKLQVIGIKDKGRIGCVLFQAL